MGEGKISEYLQEGVSQPCLLIPGTRVPHDGNGTGDSDSSLMLSIREIRGMLTLCQRIWRYPPTILSPQHFSVPPFLGIRRARDYPERIPIISSVPIPSYRVNSIGDPGPEDCCAAAGAATTPSVATIGSSAVQVPEACCQQNLGGRKSSFLWLPSGIGAGSARCLLALLGPLPVELRRCFSHMLRQPDDQLHAFPAFRPQRSATSQTCCGIE